MIDIHSHLLFGLDDGSSDIKESIRMAHEAYSSGFTDIICTPHYNKFNFPHFPKETLSKKLQALQEELKKINCPLKLHLGNEVYLDDTIETSLADNLFYSLADSKYVLIEFPMNIEYAMIDNLIFSILNSGKKPILAHPERYLYIQENNNKIYNYVDLGVLLQSNFGSILSLYNSKAKKTIKFLLKEHLISFISSDAHRSSSIYTNIESAKQKILKKISKEEFDTLTYINPQKILFNEDI